MSATLLAADLARIIKDTAIFACADAALPTIHAVRLESTPKHLLAVATDRFTLAAAVGDWHEESGEAFTVSLSLKHAQLVAKVAASVKAAFTVVTIVHTDTAVSFEFTGGETLTVPKLTDASGFPDWRRLVVNAQGTSDEVASIRSFGVNPQYLARFGRVTDSYRMVMKFSGPSKPALVSVGSQFFGLVMPVRLDEEEFAATAPEWLAPRAEPEPKKRAPRKSRTKATAA